MTRLGIGVFVALLLLILGWQLLPSLLIRLPGLLAPHVGPPREVVWDAAPAIPTAPPSERPPNIVVILADDLGWNDLSFQGGGLGGGQAKKLQLSERPQQAWLFDPANDPTEQSNLARTEPARVAELTAQLDAHDAQQSKPLWPSLLEGAIRIDPPLNAPRSPDDEYVYWAN